MPTKKKPLVRNGQCVRCQRAVEGADGHQTPEDCVKAAYARGALQANARATEAEKSADESRAKYREVRDVHAKVVKALEDKLAVKEAKERPLSDAELLAMTMIGMLPPWGHEMAAETAVARKKVRAEMQRRGLFAMPEDAPLVEDHSFDVVD